MSSDDYDSPFKKAEWFGAIAEGALEAFSEADKADGKKDGYVEGSELIKLHSSSVVLSEQEQKALAGGKIPVSELVRNAEQSAGILFDALDQNHDGILSRSEINQRLPKISEPTIGRDVKLKAP